MRRQARFGAATLFFWVFVFATPVGAETVLKPGDDIQSVVDASPVGEVFTLLPGVYRQQTVFPKDRQQFIGQRGVVFGGAIKLDRWDMAGSFWVAEDLPGPRQRPHGECGDKKSLCRHPEDLFVDGVPYQRVGSLKELEAGRWFYYDRKAYLVDNPLDRDIELSVAPLAFGGKGSNVRLRDLVVEKYAVRAQHGAIDLRYAVGWELVNVTARWNHGTGLYLGAETRVLGGSFSNNGQMGIGGDGDRSVIDGAEIAYNNYAKFSWGWEAGGTKFVRSAGLVVRNTCVHHNDGPGLWTDADNIDILYEGNRVFENAGDGIKHEISYDAIIRNNIVAHNGAGTDIWLWGSQILIQNSSNVEVYGNIVETGTDFGNAISIIHQKRGQGKYGPWNAVNNRVFDNRIVVLWPEGRIGIVADYQTEWFWENAGNSFDRNYYSVPQPEMGFWGLEQHFRRWAGIRERGMENHGTLVVEQRQPMILSCERD